MNNIPGVHVCSLDDMHPYACARETEAEMKELGKCIHCEGKFIAGVHEPKKCWLCCQGDPDEVNK